MSDMAKIDLPYVQAFRDRHGRVRHYYRRPGYARATLPGDPGSAGFMAAYAAAGERRAKPEGAGSERTLPKSINALIVAYYASAEYQGLRESTKRGYRNMLDRFRNKYGDRSCVTIRPHHLEAIFHSMAKTPGAVRNLRLRLRRAFRLAVKLGWRDDNPVTETEAPRVKTSGFKPWTEENIADYEAYWPSGTRERLALALLLYTCQRRSDVVTMGRQHTKAGRIHVCQLKGGTRLAIGIHPKLKIELDLAPLGMTYLLTQYGTPFSAAGFTAWFGEKADEAGAVGKRPHGLRKASCRRLAEVGCTAKQIAAISGHTTLKEIERYTRDADQVVLADSAMLKLQGEG